jgi:hypothetical protein
MPEMSDLAAARIGMKCRTLGNQGKRPRTLGSRRDVSPGRVDDLVTGLLLDTGLLGALRHGLAYLLGNARRANVPRDRQTGRLRAGLAIVGLPTRGCMVPGLCLGIPRPELEQLRRRICLNDQALLYGGRFDLREKFSERTVCDRGGSSFEV